MEETAGHNVAKSARWEWRAVFAVVLAATALALSDIWFDMAGHGTAFMAVNRSLSDSVSDGHTLFLVGMLALVGLQALAPSWFERHFCATLWGATALGVVAAAANTTRRQMCIRDRSRAARSTRCATGAIS